MDLLSPRRRLLACPLLLVRSARVRELEHVRKHAGCGGACAGAGAASTSNELVAAGSRTAAGAERFVESFPGTTPHGSYEALLADPDVDAIYVACPHPDHADWTIRALRAGKHVLCEARMAMNSLEAHAMLETARSP